MSKQLIIAVGREFGSGGHLIAELLAKKFELPFYDRNLLDEIANEKSLDKKELEQYDEIPKKRLLSRTVRGFSNSPEENIANLQFDFIRKMANEGKSFVIVGRCAENVLKGNPALISIFVLGDMECKIKRTQQVRGITREQAEAVIYRHDKHRKSYHNYYCQTKWGDSRNYEISVNSSKLGIDGTADLLEAYIRERIK